MFKFIDLFAGIGGFHLAMHRLGGECVFASEIDKHARATYTANFQSISPRLFEDGMFNDDIRTIAPSELPDFDILCAGFPCQPFSQAGHKRGFDDNHNSERGNLFFHIADILEAKKPKAFFLENVRGLATHDNGNTLKTIRAILEDELGYSFYIKIVNASDYGLPQLRPRAYMVGFRDEGFMRSFNYPAHKKLKYTMSDVWNGACSREVGFTLRVGGRGSEITDRRNWDSYLVDGVVKRIEPAQAKKMQGFPDDFVFPVSNTQAMKQLGNSVAIDAVEAVAANILEHMNRLSKNNKFVQDCKNKGEWSELYIFLQLLLQKKLYLADSKLNKIKEHFVIKKISTLNLDNVYITNDNHIVTIANKSNGDIIQTLDIADIVTGEILDILITKIREGKGSFAIDEFLAIQDSLGISIVKGGTSRQKSDIVLDIENDEFIHNNEGFGIKSYLGGKPTLFNASSSTNFIYEIKGIQEDSIIDTINSISTKSKVCDRLRAIEDAGGTFEFRRAENATLDYNLKLVDSSMPNIIGEMLMHYYKERLVSMPELAKVMCPTDDEKNSFEIKIKKLLIDILLGMFPGSKWDGTYVSNGTIVLKKDGSTVAFHIIKQDILKTYLYENIHFDTPSTTRHRFGQLYREKDNRLFFKLNLQLRF